MLEKISTTELADALDANASFASNIKAGRKRVPPNKCRLVSERFGIPLSVLRPDIFGEIECDKKIPPHDQ